MTNPRVVVEGEVDLEATRELRNRDPLTTAEIDDVLLETGKIEDGYFRLRVKALIALSKKFGKRRAEFVSLERSDLEVEDGMLYVTFTLRKKHKRGLFQFLKWLGKNEPSALEKPLAQLKLDWKEWTRIKFDSDFYAEDAPFESPVR